MDKLCIYFIIFTLYSASGVLQHPVLIKAEIHNDFVHYFPDNFSFGASTAAYQIEGGWNADGKVPSIWDSLTHFHKEMIVDHRNADVGPDSYHFYKKDIESLKFIGVSNFFCFYIFSFSNSTDNQPQPRSYSFNIIVFQFHGQEFFQMLQWLIVKESNIITN